MASGKEGQLKCTHEEAPRLIGSKIGSFAYLTIKDRMPVILTQVVDTLHQEITKYSSEQEDTKHKLEAGKKLIALLSDMRHQMMTDKELGTLDKGENLGQWKQLYDSLASSRKVVPSWYNVPWLFVECFMYRKIKDIFLGSEHFIDYDPFRTQKEKGFHSSLLPMQALAEYLVAKINTLEGEVSIDELHHDFVKLIQFCLWGNKTDLSLIAKYDGTQDLSQLQASSHDHLSNLLSKILCDDTEHIWDLISKQRGVKNRISYVLDNSGFELFTDLCFADWLTASRFVSHVHFEVKNIPWFVSDVTPNDLTWTLAQLKSSPNHNLNLLAERWLRYFADKTWTHACHPFWTLAHQYSTMHCVSPDLYSALSECKMVLLKGDLNYRKLLGDRDWPHTTGFKVALEGFSPTHVVVLRTLKADLVCGLKEGVAERAEKENVKWMVSGEYAVIQLSHK